jgi:hypothetical protein
MGFIGNTVARLDACAGMNVLDEARLPAPDAPGKQIPYEAKFGEG